MPEAFSPVKQIKDRCGTKPDEYLVALYFAALCKLAQPGSLP
jgi:hypothetical protein